MDPSACLEEMLSLSETASESDAFDIDDAQRLAELVVAIDGWITSGGFLPRRWMGEYNGRV